MSWIGVVTNAGQALLDQWSAGGHTLTIDGATVGSGTVAEANMRIMTALSNEEDTAQVISAEDVENGTRFKVQISAAAETSYTATEVGLWGHLDNGASTLISYHEDLSGGIQIQTSAESPDFAFALYIVHAISNDGTFSITIDPSAYVTQSTLDTAIAGIQDGIDAVITQAEVNALFT